MKQDTVDLSSRALAKDRGRLNPESGEPKGASLPSTAFSAPMKLGVDSALMSDAVRALALALDNLGNVTVGQ